MINELEKIEQEMIEIRRHLHMYPELSFEEENTAKYIAEYLTKLGIPHKTNVSGHGIVATIKGAGEGKIVALRADFDALPVEDEKDVPYKSKVSGVMHACGHDAHTASLMGVAKVAWQNKDKFNGEIRLIFQHAEEVQPGGAVGLIEAGCLEGVGAIFGNHMASQMPCGLMGYAHGPIMAASATFDLTIQGKGGHGAYPHTTVDPIVVGANIIQGFQQIVSRKTNPLQPVVVTVGQFDAGTADNIIPDTAWLAGTVRVFNQQVQDDTEKEMIKVIQGACDAFGATYKFGFYRSYPAVVTTKDETMLAKKAFDALGMESVEMQPRMGAEDFAYYVQKVPGAFFSTGAGGPEYAPHHHPKFDIDERSILFAAKGLLQCALLYLES